MLSLKKLSIFFVFIGCLSAQSVFNAYGLGLSKSIHHTSSAGVGSIGLVPTFQPGVSFDNPATWPGLNFAYVSGSYAIDKLKLVIIVIQTMGTDLRRFNLWFQSKIVLRSGFHLNQ